MILSVCIISLLINVLENMTNDMKLGKQVKFILSLILLAVIFSPFSTTDLFSELPAFSVIDDVATYSDELYNEEIQVQVSENVSEVLKDELEKNGISFDFIETDVNISDTDGISINKVKISTDNFSDAERIIKENLGEETEVINEYE